MICIYMITNAITGERYIGQTRDYQRRVWQHKSAAKKGSHLKISKAIAKYGIDNFKFDVLEECSLEELNDKERYYISELKPEYNVCAGGIGPNGLHLTDEEKERSRQAAKKQWANMTEEQKQRVIEKQLTGPRKGHEVSTETREKLRKANLGKKQSEVTVRKRSLKNRDALKGNKNGNKKIRCVETGEVFESVKQAAEHIGINPSGITSVLKGRQRKAGGYKWVYQL
mgnify:CR=1 FL=1